MYSKPSSTSFDEHLWVAQMRRALEEEAEDEDEVPVSIFNVPRVLMATDPDSYAPQEVAIGPYHYRRPDLYEMERYKLSAAKRSKGRFRGRKFPDIVRQLTKHEARVRASYHKYLSLSGETLAWMMAVDGAFLLEFLHVYAVKQGKAVVLARLSSRMSHLLDYTGQKSTHNAIMRDIVMLENQLPLHVLRTLLGFQSPTLDEADDLLHSMLLGFCREVSPFKTVEYQSDRSPRVSLSECSHLLDFLYALVSPPRPTAEAARREHAVEIEGDDDRVREQASSAPLGRVGSIKRTLLAIRAVLFGIWRAMKKVNHKGPVINFIRRVLNMVRPFIGFFLKLPMKIVSNVPGLKLLQKPIEMMVSSQAKEGTGAGGEEGPEGANKPPLIEEIAIPSVTELTKSGVQFRASEGNISAVGFDPKTVTFSLPVMWLDVNSGTILRNLVAYEASNASGPLAFTRYTELINGIIDTEDDVRLLRQQGIIVSSLKSDEEVANLCNGMSKSIRLTKVPFLDKVIEDVNKYHEGRLRVKYGKFMKNYVFGSWKLLTLFATLLMLLLMAVQSFCSVFTCSRLLKNLDFPDIDD